MTRFVFRLEPVLGWRKAQLEAEEFRLKQMLAERERLEREIADVEAARLEAERQVRGAEVVAATDLWALGAYRKAAGARAEAMARRLAEHAAGIRAQRERIGVARQRCRLLERLKERRLADWLYANGREMENFAGDAYLARWNTP